MRSPFRIHALCFAATLLWAASSNGRAQNVSTSARPSVRVTKRVDPTTTSSIPGTHPPVVDHAKIGERLAPTEAIHGAILVLQPSPEQEAALAELLDAQQDRNSSSFHKWLTPQSFGESFGVSREDIGQVSAWLSDSGFSVDSVSQSGRFLVFSGTVGAVETAFHTEMHRLTVNGEDHISNTTDIAIPSALAPVVKGVAQLNDFRPKSSLHKGKRVSVYRNAPNSFELAQPEYTSGGDSFHAVAPGDIATIYNATPLTASGVDGTGTTIAVIGDSDVNLSDAQTFRTLFGLPKNDPNVIIAGPRPSINNDADEADLDIEMAGSLATGATVDLIIASNVEQNGIEAAALYAVDNNVGDIITMSFGLCETLSGSSYTGFWNTLWAQAATQGQTVFVSTGDTGADGGAFGYVCAAVPSAFGLGYSVNGLGSSAYNVAVGGTMFFDPGPQQYWQTGPSAKPYNSALGYIPEAAWNEGALTTTLLSGNSTALVSGYGDAAGGGGVSIYTPRPAWQAGLGILAGSDPAGSAAGSPIAGLHRLVPDVAMLAANHDATLFCSEGVCSETAFNTYYDSAAGTSVAAPAMASAQALIDSVNGGRQGNANYYYYALARQDSANSVTSCQSTLGTIANPVVTLPASTCNFHDIVTGSNIVPGYVGDTVGFGFNAGAGFDETTGLGSVNIANVAKNWSSVQFNPSTTTFTLAPTTGTYGSGQAVSFQVTANNGAPTGFVDLASDTVKVPITDFVLNAGFASGTVTTLPAGTYSVHAHYFGDGVYAASDSAPIGVSIAKADSATVATVYDLFFSSSPYPANTFTYGARDQPYIVAVVSSSVNGQAPAGTVTFAVQKDGVPLAPVTSALDSTGSAYFLAGPFTSRLPATYPALPPGSYTVTANYTGSNFVDSSASVSFVMNKAVPTVTFTAGTEDIRTDRKALLNVGLAGSDAAGVPTGTVTYTDSTTNTVLGTVSLRNAAAEFRTPALTSDGTHLITAAYSGDSYFTAATATVTVMVGDGAKSTTTLVEGGGPGALVGDNDYLAATVSPLPAAYSPVYFYEGGVLVGTGTTNPTTGTAYGPVNVNAAGEHKYVAVFAGDQQYRTSRASIEVTIAKDPTSIQVTGPTQSFYGTAVSYTVHLTNTNPALRGAFPVPLTGQVCLYAGGAGGTLVGSAMPVYNNGQLDYEATVTTSILPVSTGNLGGTEAVLAVYQGDNNYAASQSNALSVVVTGPTTFISVNNVSIVYGTGPTQLTGQVSYNGPQPPDGAVTFTVNGGPSVTATCTGSSSPLLCTASYPTAGLDASSSAYPIQVNEAASKYYPANSGVGYLTVPQTSQTITFSLPATATYGTDGPFALNAVASSGLDITYYVDGPAKIVGKTLQLTGAGSVYVAAAQDGNGKYAPATPTILSITVNPASPTVKWAQPTAIVYGTPLTAAQLSATASVPGSFTYSPAGGSVLHAGAQTLSVTFTPTDTVDYNPVKTAVTLTVNKATPAITWPPPAPINYGTPLGSTQLNATANLPGFFVYFPAAGILLTGGTQPLSVIFTPTDTTDYNGSTAANAITVNESTVSLGISSGTQTYPAWTNFVVGPSHTGSRVPTGTVTLYNNGGAWVTLALGGNGLAYYTGNPPLNAGVNTLTASYSGDAYYPPGLSAGVTMTVLPAAVNFQASCFGAQVYTQSYQCTVNLSAGTSSPPTGSIQYSLDGGAPVTVAINNSGNAPFTVSTIPSAGSHTLAIAYGGQGNYAAAKPIADNFTTQPGQTQMQVYPSTYYVAHGSAVVLSGSATSLASGVPGGTVTFYDNGTAIGTSPIGTNGAVSFTVSNIAKGLHSYSASYAGAANYASAKSSASSVTAF